NRIKIGVESFKFMHLAGPREVRSSETTQSPVRHQVPLKTCLATKKKRFEKAIRLARRVDYWAGTVRNDHEYVCPRAETETGKVAPRARGARGMSTIALWFRKAQRPYSCPPELGLL